MLNHLGQTQVAEKVQNAWLKTLEAGIHTKDIFNEGVSARNVGTREFAEAVISHLGQKPERLKPATYTSGATLQLPRYQRKPPRKKELMGVDLFLHWAGSSPEELAEKVRKINLPDVELTMITNRGIKVWPEGFPETFCTDHWRCRFKQRAGSAMDQSAILQLLTQAQQQQLDVIKTENLYAFDGTPAFSLGQGQ